jgi:pilus assembly protein CpaB
LVLSIGVTAFLYRRVYANGGARPSTRQVVAANEQLRAGSAPSAKELRIIDWPANVPIEGAFSKIEDVAGRALIYPVDAGEPIHQRDLASPGSGFGLTAKIPEGMRAVAVKTNEVVAVGGYLFPGCHVDVLLSFHPEGNQPERTTTVLEDVQVLSAGTKMDPDPQAKPENVTVVTLLVTPQESERLVWATSLGTVQFVLRNGADKHVRGVAQNLAELMAPHKEQKPAAVTHRVATTPAYEVETLAGEKRSVTKFQP